MEMVPLLLDILVTRSDSGASIKMCKTDRINAEMSCSEGVYLGRSDGAAMVGLADDVVDDHLGDLPRHFLLRLHQSTNVLPFQSFQQPL